MSDVAGHGTPDESQMAELPGYEFVQLSRIKGLHPCLDQLYEELSIPPLWQVPSDIHSAEAFMEVLTLHPLRVAKKDGRMKCTGNVRLYWLATRFLLDKSEVPYVVEALLTDAQIKRRALNELVYGMAYLGAHTSDIKVMAEIARRATAASYMTVAGPSVETMISKLYRVDKRKLKTQPQVAPSQTENLEQGTPHATESEITETVTEEPTTNAAEEISAGPVIQMKSPEGILEGCDPSEAPDGQK